MAQIKLYIKSDNLILLNALKDEDDVAVEAATVKLHLFKQETLSIDVSTLTFTSGGVVEPAIGDILEGATGGATAKIGSIVLTSGAWADGDAAGRIGVLNQIGTFEAEDLDQVDGQANIATIAADSSGAETANGGAKAKIPIRSHGLIGGQYIHIQGTTNYDGTMAIDSVEENKIIIPKAFVAEKFTNNEVVYVGLINGCNIGMSDESGGNYEGVLPDTILGLVKNDWYYRVVEIVKGTSNLVIMQLVKAAYYLEVAV